VPNKKQDVQEKVALILAIMTTRNLSQMVGAFAYAYVMYQARGEEKLGRKHNVIMVKAPNEV
jgi:hypothetical protein